MVHVKFYQPFYERLWQSASERCPFDIRYIQDDKAVEPTLFMKDIFAHFRFY